MHFVCINPVIFLPKRTDFRRVRRGGNTLFHSSLPLAFLSALCYNVPREACYTDKYKGEQYAQATYTFGFTCARHARAVCRRGADRTGQYARRLGRKRSEHRLSVLCGHDRAGARRRCGHHARQHRGDGPEHGLSSGASLGGMRSTGPAFSPRAATSAAPAALRPTGTSMCSRTGSRARTSAVFSCTPGSIPTASRETAGRSLTPCPRAARRVSILNGWLNTTATTTSTPVSRRYSSSSWTARPRSSAIMMWTASISTTTSIPARISMMQRPSHATARTSAVSTTGAATT